MQKIALIPSYCPEGRMIELIKKLSELDFSIVVIDDGSGKDFDEIFKQAASYANVQRYAPNRGKGEALKYGLRYIKKHFSTPYTVVTADADGQHRVEDIVKVGDMSVSHPDSLILGKRELDKSSPIKSRIGNGISRVLYRLTTGRNIYETQTGLRAFSDRLLPRFLDLPGHRYEYEIDMLLESSDIDIIEAAIQTVYFDNNAATHFRPFEDTVSLDKEFFRYKLPSLIAGAAGILLFILLSSLTKTWLLPCIGARVFTIVLKYILNRVLRFAEKAPIGRYLITSLIILICDIGVMWALTAIGVNMIAAKFLSSFLMIGVSLAVKRLYMKSKFE